MAKRNCRRTEKESIIHDTAVKIRKMTDEQLVDFIENIPRICLDDFLNVLTCENIPGIGAVTLKKIKAFTEKFKEDYYGH